MLKKVNSEKGSIILIVLMVLMLISMFGFTALNSATTEITVSHNGRCYKQNFYRAEGAIMEVSQILQTAVNPDTNLKPVTSPDKWLTDGSSFNPESADWTGSNSASSSLYGDNETEYSVVFEGLAPGASYNMTQPTQMWEYTVYGKSKLCNGEIGVVAGYRRRF